MAHEAAETVKEVGAPLDRGDAGREGERSLTFDFLLDIFHMDKDGVKSVGTKGLLKLLASAVYQCNNRLQRAQVRRFIKHFRNPNLEVVQQAFYVILRDSLSTRENYVATNATSKTCLELLKWIVMVGRGASQYSVAFCELFSILLSRIQGKSVERSAERKLKVLCDAMEKDVLKQFLKDVLKFNGGLVAASMIITYLHRKDRFAEISKSDSALAKSALLELFSKECLTTKSAKSKWMLEKVSDNLLPPILTEEDFKNFLLPTIQKAMLRSPEIAIEAVGFSIKPISFDLSPFAVELGKILGGSLHSQEEVTRQQALFVSTVLLSNVVKMEAAKSVIGWYLDIYLGAEGKLTVTAQKIHILQTIKQLSGCNVPKSEKHELTSYVVQRCVKILETEVHEGTLVEVVDVLDAWIPNLINEIPSELYTYLSKSLPSQKGTVRTALCQILVRLLLDGRNNSYNLLLEIAKNNFEKSFSQVTQVSGLSESIAIAVVQIRGNFSNLTDQNKSTYWSLFSHINEKFLSACNNSAVLHTAFLTQEALNHMNENMDRIYDAAVLALTVSKDYQIRLLVKNHLFETFKTMDRKQNSHEIYVRLLDSFTRNFESTTFSDHVKEEVLKNFALQLSTLDDDTKTTLAIQFIVPAHSTSNKELWIPITQSMKLDPGRVLTQRKKKVDEKFIQNFDGSQQMQKILRTVVFVSGETAVKSAIERFNTLMSDPDIVNVSTDDYFIFRTPEGQLFDTSVMENLDAASKNMKRESRVYSYKEQLEEIQLRKELEEKRKKSGKPVIYTQKQQEVIKAQVAKESLVRANIQKLNSKVAVAMGILNSLFEGNPGVMGMFTKNFIYQLIGIMRSPIAASEAVAFFVKLGKYFFVPDFRGVAIAYRCLRLISPTCDLPKEWEEEKLRSAVFSTVEYIRIISQEDEGLSAGGFSYCFPMLRSATKQFSNETSLITSILSIIQTVSKDAWGRLKHKDGFIPRSDVVELLYQLLGTNSGTSQQIAFSALLELTKVASTENTVDLLEEKEIEFHLTALTSHLKIIRETGLKCLLMLCPFWKSNDEHLQKSFVAGIYREKFDCSSELVHIAEEIWEKGKLSIDLNLYNDIFQVLLHPCEEVRASGSKAFGDFMKQHPSKVGSAVEDLINSYHDYLVPTPAVVDNFGRVLQEGIDKWEGRCGVGLGMREIAPVIPSDTAKACMEWIVTTTLSDRSQAVHNIMLEAAVEIVGIHGTACLNDFINTIESFLEKAGKSGQYDNVRQACVVLMGCLARHLDPTDSRVKSIFGTLIDTLSTPSEKVQESVANCLPALVHAVNADSSTILKRLIEKLFEAENYGERRGAAYGIAGMIKGLGILSLKQHDIMNILATGMQEKKNWRHREGALMALELLCEFLGRLFEPYIVHVLPYLLQCLGDSNTYVREATENTAKRVMSRLSGHGVKLVLPALLGALDEDSWRTKRGSVDLLGRMSYCAPKQLSGCLPMIVPRLIEVLGDSHVKVQESGAKALGLIGSVIQNPEIQSVVPVLLQALQDPGKRATSCLHSLLQTEFVHFVDPPSLALIMPVVQRAFQDRSTENRKMACQVIGNMYSLTDHSDLAPYMENVMPGIKASLVDPVPEVRAVAAKALGAMAKGMGDRCYDELLPWLMKTLVSEANSVDRSGAAQGLAEVIGSLGEDKLHRFMPEIIRKADSDDIAPHVRDGYMMTFIYMPSVFEKEFVIYIGQIINPILKALADENEFVRDTALRAGQRIVTGFADTAITLLLPELERGIFDENWRIRFSSVQLLGDLLYKISGVSGKMSTESAGDDDNFGTEQSQQTIIHALGPERRNRVLAGLYMGRSDVALMVRQAALHVWKVVVTNTPKTLREILPTLFSLLLGCLASHSHDKRQVAARTLGDLVRKLGEKILPEIIPILEKGLESNRADEREGVCIGLSEIMASTSREMVLAFVDNLVPTLRRALCEPTPQVRAAAAQTFASLHSTVGSRALDEIVPFLMKKLGDPVEGEYALDGLGQILAVKSKAVMPYLIPQLTAHPVNTKALAILATVADDSLSRHLGKILPALLSVLMESAGTPTEEEELEYCQRIILTVTEDQGVRLLIDELLSHSKTDSCEMKRATVSLLSIFCINSKADLEPYISQLIKGLIQLMTETDEVVLNFVAEGLAAVVKSLDSSEKLNYVGDVRQAIRFVQSDLKGKSHLPGLCTSKGISPILPIFREALLNGGADVKEQAAIGMGELIELSTEVALKPSVTHITGPLIRILGDRYGPNVKTAVLETLTLLLAKVGIHLKAFFPQLQTTFLKASNDPNSVVRLKAASALAQLTPLHSKPK